MYVSYSIYDICLDLYGYMIHNMYQHVTVLVRDITLYIDILDINILMF